MPGFSLRLLALTALLSVLIPAAPSYAAGMIAGFTSVSDADGIAIWKKGADYVQIVSPAEGAALRLLHGDVIPSDGAGTNFARRDMREWWEEWKTKEPSAVLLLNAQFFNTNNPAKSPLAFSAKIKGIVYPGYGDETEYGSKKMILRLGGGSATIEKYDDDAGSLYQLPDPDIIVGLKPDVSKSGNIRKGRTFIAATDGGDILIFTSPKATQRYAARILTVFGANRSKIMMLDGGGSTQLVHEGRLVIPSVKRGAAPVLRKVPLAIGVVAGR